VTYYYKIAAVDEVPNYGTNSTVKSGIPTDVTPPAQVQNVSVTVIYTGNELNITWSPNIEPDLVKYRVYRSTTSGFTPNQANWLANTTDNYYHDTGLVDGQTYYYRISAVDDGGPNQNEGVPSNEVSGTPQDTTPPGQVTGLQVIVVPSGNRLKMLYLAMFPVIGYIGTRLP